MVDTVTNPGKAACASAYATLVMGVCVIVGWQFEADLFKRPVTSLVTMNPAAAVAFILAGASLALSLQPGRGRGGKWRARILAARLCALVVTLIGAAKLLDVWWGWDLGVDRWLFASKLAEGIRPPDRMAPMTALHFLLLGGALLGVDARHRTARFGVEFSAAAVGFGSLLTVLAYAYDLDLFHAMHGLSPMALPTAITFCVASLGLLLSHTDHGLLAVFAGDSGGGKLARRLLPAAVLVPAALGWLTLAGEKAGIYHGELGEAVFAAGNILVFTLLVGWSAKRLYNADLRRKTAEEAMRESEERFAGAFEHAPIGVALVSPGGRWLKVNRALCALVGYSEAELLARTFQDITHPRDLEADLEHVRRLLAGEIRAYQIEKRYVHRRGHSVTVLLSVSLVRDDQGKPLYFISHVQDITERERVATALRESKRFLQSTLDALSAHIAILDEQGTILEVNAAWNSFADGNQFKGRLRGVGDNYLQICDSAASSFSDEASLVAGGIRAVMAGQSNEFHLEYPCHGPRGQRWFIVRVTRFHADGPVRVVVAHENITERKLVEEALRASQANMADAQRIAHFASWELDLTSANGVDSNPLRWSDEMFRIAGYEPGAVAVSSESFFRLVPGDEHGLIRQAVAEAIRDRKEYSIVHRIIRPDGDERIVHETGQVSFDEKTGQPLKLVGTTQDITGQRRAEASIRLQAHMLDHIGRAVIATDPAGRITYVNRFTEQLYGWSAAEMLGQNVQDVTIPQSSREPWGRIMAQLQRGESWSGEFNVRHRDGTEFPVFAANTALLDQRGEVTGIVSISSDITERIRAAEELRRSEREQRALAEQLSIEKARLDTAQAVAKLGSWETDVATGVVTWSDETYRIFERDPAHPGLTHRDFLGLVHPDDRLLVDEAFTRSLASQASHTIEHRILTPDGRIKTVEERWETFFDGRAGPRRVFGTCQDITARKRTEEALREAEAKYRSIFENSNDGIFQNTPEGRFLSANPALARMLGFASPEELIRERTDLERQGYAEPALRQEFQRRLEERGFINNFEYEVRRKDGTKIWVSENTRIVRDAAGQALYYEGSVQDITARKRSEEALRANVEEFRTLAEALPQIVWVTRPDGWHTHFNQRWMDYTGLTLEESLGHGWLPPLHPEDQPRAAKRWQQATESGEAYEIEYRLRGADGVYHWMLGRALPLRDATGDIVKWFGTCTDIHDLKVAELEISRTNREIERLNADLEQRVAQRTEALFAATREAERANQAKTEFLSRTSHELRTPMNAILGFGQLLEMEESLGPESRESVEQILRAGRHLLTLIDEVLDISNAESGSITLALEPVAVDQLVEETLGLVRPLGAERGVELELLPVLERGRCVLADPQRLKQVLLNLLSNAIKYNRPGGRVTLGCARVPGITPPALRLCVKDTGPGIAAGKLARLFTPFDRLDAERTQTHIAGTGLGLAVSKRMVELMGGTLGVASVVGEGSAFWVELPSAATLPGADAPGVLPLPEPGAGQA